MKRTTLFLSAVVGAGLLGSSAAQAGDRVSFGFDFGFNGGRGPHFDVGFHRGRGYDYAPRGGCYAPPVHTHHCVRVPIYSKVWVPARYETVFSGYDHCGRPIYRQVCVNAGYYRTVVTGYHCDGCGRNY